jgi:hypothetical protein
MGLKYTFVTSYYQNKPIMQTNEHLFLKARIKAVNPTWTEAQIDAEVNRLVNGNGEMEESGDGCIICGA